MHSSLGNKSETLSQIKKKKKKKIKKRIKINEPNLREILDILKHTSIQIIAVSEREEDKENNL